MTSTIAILAPGAMGGAVGRCLAAAGARVITVVEGRSERTAARAREAGMTAVSWTDIAAADLILSIVPPAEAVGLASSLAPILTESQRKPAFIDFNAVNPNTMNRVSAALAGSGCPIIDGSIIGPPPSPGKDATTFYVSGDDLDRTEILSGLGLKLRRIDGPLGAASALKMVYAGINKGAIALGTAMLLASVKADCAPDLSRELSESRPEVLARLVQGIPDMYGKAYRWVAEMREIAEFLGPDDPASGMFEAAAGLFARMAGDREGNRTLAKALNGVLGVSGDGA
ncbi:NAD(P)-dependent oxidoreductase [Telmatospirillum siberiense]|uniref:6-phosphogluconate dehydrogenase n=1 Tax=Telmatospirillum siberiense TaxID=382514 RepID=A0A2N3PWC3_9PROT|nr:NAD(P)-dependent oxidoreductase [Telmatospirillum siberiense]PKU24713.1 6-phosphogluconate dehydrogenase [Telmatospirillum siberiense]